MEFKRFNYTFRYFFDTDVEERGHIDIEGYDVYDENGGFIAEIEFISEKEIKEMSEVELEELIEDNLVYF